MVTASGSEPAFAITPLDTLGAGDVWHGAFALLLGEGASPPDAIRFASAVAAIKCTRTNGRAGYPTRAETESFMKETPLCS
jgi:sulfofructose kinase